MSVRAISLAIIMTSHVASVDAAGDSLPNTCVILPLSQGPAMIDQCSRVRPERVTGFWTPSAKQVQIVEQRLPALLRTSGHKINLAQSRRQYIGVISADKRLIYVNAFSITEPAPFFRINWRKTAFTLCDGGDEFWGVAFDRISGKFDYLGFNGLA